MSDRRPLYRRSARWAPSLAAIAVMGLAPMASGEMLMEGFEDGAVGAKPDADAVRPNNNVSDVAATVIAPGDNAAGSGQGLNLLDDNDGTGPQGSDASLAYENNFVTDSSSNVSSAAISFDIARNSDLSDGTNDSERLTFSVREFVDSDSAELNSSSDRILEIRFQADGEFRVDGGNGNTSRDAGELAVGESNNVQVFINDDESNTLDFIAPDGSTGTLAANSFFVFLNGELVNGDEANTLEQGAVGNSASLGRAGFISFNSSSGLDYDVDNFTVGEVPIPEPNSMGLLAACGLMLFRRRKNAA